MAAARRPRYRELETECEKWGLPKAKDKKGQSYDLLEEHPSPGEYTPSADRRR